MNIYDVSNKNKHGFWCAAPDAETAKDIALHAGHAKKRENLHVTDVTQRFLDLDPQHHDLTSVQAILAGTRAGRVIGRLDAHNAAEFMRVFIETGQPPVSKPTVWEVV